MHAARPCFLLRPFPEHEPRLCWLHRTRCWGGSRGPVWRPQETLRELSVWPGWGPRSVAGGSWLSQDEFIKNKLEIKVGQLMSAELILGPRVIRNKKARISPV